MLDIKPTESPGFLVGRVAHALKLGVQEFLDHSGIPLSAEEASILTVLAHLDGPERMKPLAKMLGRDATTVSRQIAGLERQKLVKRSPCPGDGRATVVKVTKSGERLVERTLPMTNALREQAMQGISSADAKVLARALMRMLQNLNQDQVPS